MMLGCRVLRFDHFFKEAGSKEEFCLDPGARGDGGGSCYFAAFFFSFHGTCDFV